MQPINIIMIYKRHFSLSVCPGFCMAIFEDPSLRFVATVHGKDQVLWNVLEGTLLHSLRQDLSSHAYF